MGILACHTLVLKECSTTILLELVPHLQHFVPQLLFQLFVKTTTILAWLNHTNGRLITPSQPPQTMVVISDSQEMATSSKDHTMQTVNSGTAKTSICAMEPSSVTALT